VLLFDLIRPVAAPVARRAPALRLEVTRLTVRVRSLPTSLDGFTIAQVSDIHIGNDHWSPKQLDAAEEVIQRENPDIVVNTGDFLEGESVPRHVAQAAGRLALPGEGRNFAVLGNHDYTGDDETVEQLKSELGEAGIQVLENELVCLCRETGGISLAGLTEQAPGWDAAVHGLSEAGLPRVALVHIPDCAEQLPEGIADLILSGHTHGGQIALPGLEAQTVRALCGSRYVEGMYMVNGSPVYVNRGLGYSGLPMRFRANPEVTLITLSR
jgi:predicted MPP superfamily phosphohydrolase